MAKKNRRKSPSSELRKPPTVDVTALQQTLSELADVNRRLEHAAAMLTEPAPAPADEAAADETAVTPNAPDENEPETGPKIA